MATDERQRVGFSLGHAGYRGSGRWGLKAIFRLENGFNVNNGTLGQGGREFGRQAYVGLSSNSIGTFTLGRQYNAIQDVVAPLGVASVLTQFATHPFDNDNLNNTYRTDNSVKYATPNMAGFQAEALYGFACQWGSVFSFSSTCHTNFLRAT